MTIDHIYFEVSGAVDHEQIPQQGLSIADRVSVLWDRGLNTLEIAEALGIGEPFVCSALARRYR